jgi:hypothetical protein
VREVSFDDYLLGEVIVAWDGRVVELFRRDVAETTRVHVRQLELELHAPDRRGRHTVDFATTTRGRGGFKLTVPPEAWDEAKSLLDEINAARG